VIPVIVGAIAAAVLYMILASELLGGTIFPAFVCATGKTCSTLTEVVSNYSPNGGANYAKAIVWGFIAGFAERLVPDTIGTFVKTANSAAEKAK
jgi:hypothetical protein